MLNSRCSTWVSLVFGFVGGLFVWIGWAACGGRGEIWDGAGLLYYIPLLMLPGFVSALWCQGAVEWWVTIGAFFGQATYTVYDWRTSGEVSNIWPLTLVALFVTSLIAAGGASIGKAVVRRRAHRPR